MGISLQMEMANMAYYHFCCCYVFVFWGLLFCYVLFLVFATTFFHSPYTCFLTVDSNVAQKELKGTGYSSNFSSNLFVKMSFAIPQIKEKSKYFSKYVYLFYSLNTAPLLSLKMAPPDLSINERSIGTPRAFQTKHAGPRCN